MKRFQHLPKNTHIKLRTGDRPKQYDTLFHTQGTVVKSDYVNYQSPDQDPTPDEVDESPITQTAEN